MKKILYCAAMALAVVLVGCNPPVEDNKYTSISLKPNSLTMISGDTTQISLLYQPTSSAHPDATWTSSDTNIVKVIGKGIIAAKDTIGSATITAQVNELTATCEVTVDAYENLIYFADIMYFPATKTPIGDVMDTTYYGTTYKVQLNRVTCLIPAMLPDNLSFDSETLNGEGYAIFADVALYFVNDKSSEFDGRMLSDRFAIFRNDSLDTEWASQAGYFDPAIVGAVFVDETIVTKEDFVAAYTEGAYGAHWGECTIDADGVNYYNIFDGIIPDGYIGYTFDEEGKYAGTVYDLTLEWFGGYYGIAIDWENSYMNEEGEIVVALKEPYEKVSEVLHYTSGSSVKSAPSFIKTRNDLNRVMKGEKVNLGKAEKLQVMPRTAMR